MESPGKSTSKVSRKETRPRSPPDRKRVKASEEFNSAVCKEQPQSPTLKGDDIQALTIRQEDLEKLRIPQPPKDSQKPLAMTRVLVRKTRPPDPTRKGIAVSVARPLPHSAVPQPLEYTGPGGPRFDSDGMIVPHSILGRLEDFRRDMEARGEIELASRVPVPKNEPSPLAREQRDGSDPRSDPMIQPCDGDDFQSHALQHWDDCMAERRRQQYFISRLLQRPAEQLLMNQSNLYRQTQEQRELISKGLPALHTGHGYRVGSEYWSLPQCYGDQMSGITSTLTQTERGHPPPVTHVAQPHTIRLQSGNVLPETSVSRAWDSSLYLKQRREELKDVLRELDFNQPEIDGLEVMGSGRPFTSVTVKRSSLLGGKEGDEEEDERREGDLKENEDPLSQYDDVLLDAVLVPALRFCGEPAHWTGSSSSHKGEVGISACVTFEAVTGESVSSHIDLENHGSTAIYYSWQKIPHTHSFLEAPAAHTHAQSFYFNTTMGVILPGDRKHVTFTFKSARAGILSEVWHLNTHPVLLGGATLQLTLRGVALYQDTTAPQRHALQMEIQHKEAVSVCVSLVSDLLRGIRTPERPSSPAQLYRTEEDHFHNINPKLHYHCETIEALKNLWKEATSSVHCDVKDPPATEPQEWDLSVSTLRQAVLALPKLDSAVEMEVEVEVEGLRREQALDQLNTLLLVLQSPSEPAPPLTPHTIGLQLWRELVDGVVLEATDLRQTLGMPEVKTWGAIQPEPQEESCTKMKKEKPEKKGAPPAKEEKKGAGGREDKKGTPRSTPVKDKPAEDRPGSRKKGREEKTAGKLAKEPGRETPTNGTSPELEDAERPVENIDPQLKEKYRKQLHHQVYVRTERMLLSLWDLLEDAPKLDKKD